MDQAPRKANQARTRIRRRTRTAPVGTAAKTSFSASIRLKGLEPEASYTVRDFDSKRRWSETGETLMQRGIRVEMPNPRSSKLFFLYKSQ
jgi:hypothetical protein